MAESTFIDASESILATGGAPVKSPFLDTVFQSTPAKTMSLHGRRKKSWENRSGLCHMGLKKRREQLRNVFCRALSKLKLHENDILNCQKALL